MQGNPQAVPSTKAAAAPRIEDNSSPPQPGTLTRATSVSDDTKHRIIWTVDARKLEKNDKQAVSPQFELCFGPRCPSVIFQIMISPKVINEGKGGCCFKKSHGQGSLQLRCA